MTKAWINRIGHREEESNVNLYRVDRGLTRKALASLSGTHTSTICGLINGTVAPTYAKDWKDHYAGEIKPFAQRIATVLGASLEELYPRYICQIEKDPQSDYLPEQIHDCIGSEYSRTISGSTDDEAEDLIFLHDALADALKSLPKRYLEVIYLRFFMGFTMEEIGQHLARTRERIRQMESRALRMLRHPSRSHKLREFSAGFKIQAFHLGGRDGEDETLQGV